MPSIEQLTKVKLLLEVVGLIVLVPIFVWWLLTDPFGAAKRIVAPQ